MKDNRIHDAVKSYFDVWTPLVEQRAACERAGSEAPPAAAAATLIRLEPSDSNITGDSVGMAVVVPCKCRCRTCEKCGGKLGWRVRQNLLNKSDEFRNPAMLTLTVDRSKFDSAEQAHETITNGHYVARLMRRLGVSMWFWVLEFQTKSGEGWPHWHLLIDLADVGGRLDLAKAWRLWRDTWHLGGLDLQVKKSFASREHAVMYVTKYLTKMPEAFPLWVVLKQKVVRFIGGCKALGSLTGQPSRVRQEMEEDPQGKLFREPRTELLIRMAQCEMKATVFCVDGNPMTGVGAWSYVGSVPARVQDIVELSLSKSVSLRIAAVEWGEKELWCVTDASVGGVVASIRKSADELAAVGYSQAWRYAVADREAGIYLRYFNFWERRKGGDDDGIRRASTKDT